MQWSGDKCDYIAGILIETGDAIEKHELPSSNTSTIHIIDALAVLHRYQTLGSRTCGDLTQQYAAKMVHLCPADCKTVHFMGDRYDFDSRAMREC